MNETDINDEDFDDSTDNNRNNQFLDQAEYNARIEKFRAIGYHSGYNATMATIDNNDIDDDNNVTVGKKTTRNFYQNGFESGYSHGYYISYEIGNILGQQVASNVALKCIFRKSDVHNGAVDKGTCTEHRCPVASDPNDIVAQEQSSKTAFVPNDGDSGSSSSHIHSKKLVSIIRNGLLHILSTESNVNSSEQSISDSTYHFYKRNADNNKMLSDQNTIRDKLDSLLVDVQRENEIICQARKT